MIAESRMAALPGGSLPCECLLVTMRVQSWHLVICISTALAMVRVCDKNLFDFNVQAKAVPWAYYRSPQSTLVSGRLLIQARSSSIT